MAKQVRVFTGSQWEPLAVTLPDLSNYSTTTQMNTAIDNAKGLVLVTNTTLTNVAQADITNCFSSIYKNYRFMIKSTAASTTNFGIYLQFLNGTTPDSSSSYYYGMLGIRPDGGSDNISSSPTTNFIISDITSNNPTASSASFDIYSPNEAVHTTMLGQSTGHHSLMRFRTGGCYHVIASAYNGIRLTTFGSATFSASVQIYGYRNS